ncbi:putative ribonuclease H-like domain-containing protein [Tanacetum coccineum]
MSKINEEHCLISSVQQLRRTNHKDFQNCLFACYLSQIEPKKPVQAQKDPSWVEAMQDELLQNKKDERGIVAKNKARLVAQGYTQEEGIDYDEVFAPVARIEAIRLFMAYASFKGFVVYQMDVKSAFLYAKIEQEVYICQPHGFEDPDFPNKVYKVEKALYGLHQAPRACQDKCMAEILKKFNFATVKTASTPMKPNKALIKDEEAEDIDVHLYRSMIGLLMYLTAFRPDIIFDVCAYARFQVTPKTSRLHVVKRIFRYLKGQPKLGLWYPRDSLFYLEAFSDSDYVGASLNKKSTTGGCQFLGKRLISWQCKKQTMVANSTTEAEYVAATNCYRQPNERPLRYLSLSGTTNLVADKTVHKEWGDKMERAATTASSSEVKQDSAAQTRFEAASNSPMNHLSQELTHLEVEGSEGFHQIVDFLNSTYIRYALTKNPIIYVSLIHQFWETAFASTSENGEMEITATIDGRIKTITEASIRRHLKLED